MINLHNGVLHYIVIHLYQYLSVYSYLLLHNKSPTLKLSSLKPQLFYLTEVSMPQGSRCGLAGSETLSGSPRGTLVTGTCLQSLLGCLRRNLLPAHSQGCWQDLAPRRLLVGLSSVPGPAALPREMKTGHLASSEWASAKKEPIRVSANWKSGAFITGSQRGHPTPSLIFYSLEANHQQISNVASFHS